MRAIALCLLFAAETASAEPAKPRADIGLGVEAGVWTEIVWQGGAVELDAPVTDALSVRATARWQSFSDVHDECSFDFLGSQLDATGGLVWHPESDWRHAHPFFAGQLGAGLERLHETCPGAKTFSRWSWMVQGSAGIDVDADPASRVALRIAARLTIADFVTHGGPQDVVFNQEVGVAVLVIGRL